MSDIMHRRLAKCHVLFLGDSTPKQANQGLKALQQPLMKCYPVDNSTQVEGIDSWLTMFTSGILLQFVGNKSSRPTPIWFPIQNLHIAAATKCINYVDSNTGQRVETEFEDINHPAAAKSSHPPLFSIIVRKTAGKRILRCYTFLVRDEKPAMAMVDAAKYAFTNRSGWSNGHPPEQMIRNEMMPGADESDEEFDSVSTANKRNAQNGAPNLSAENQSQNISDSDISHANESKESKTFPAHLVRKYTLTNTRRGGGPINTNRGIGPSPGPSRRPIPAEFMYDAPPGGDSVRTSRHGERVVPRLNPHMFSSQRGPLAIPPGLEGSLRVTSSVRVVTDPYSRRPMLERVIREPVPVPVPVYHPPPPPQIIREVTPIYIPQPPEIRHIPVDREIPVPIEVPVPYPANPAQHYQRSDSKGSKRDRKHKSRSHHTFRNYEIFDEQFARRGADRPSYFINQEQPFNLASPTNGFHVPYGERYRAPDHRKESPRRRRRGRSHSSSSRSSSSEDERDRRYNDAWDNIDSRVNRTRGIEITELSSPDEAKPSTRKSSDLNGNHNRAYKIRELDHETANLHIQESYKGRDAPNGDNIGREFKWSTASKPSKEERRSERRSNRDERKSRDIEESPEIGRGKLYVGADLVGSASIRERRGRINEEIKRSSFVARRNEQEKHEDRRREKKKEKKKRDKTPSRHEAMFPDYDGAGGEYYLKEPTENPPRNWMDQQKEYMNERAFSSSLANDPDEQITNAYALNQGTDDDDMFDRAMPAPPGPAPSGGIPIPPPLPADMQIGGKVAADLY